MKKKFIIIFLIITVIGGIFAFYQCYLGDYLLQSKFALNTPIQTVQRDRFNYIWETKESDPFVGTGITYKIYHYEHNQWRQVMECGGEYCGDHEIKISSAYEDKNILVYKLWALVKQDRENQYIMIDKSNNKAADLSTKINYAYSDMTKEQIRKDHILNQAKTFIFNYPVSQNDYYKDAFDKVKQAFQEK